MPWNASDAERFKKGLSRKQKKKWAAIANGALQSCVEGGESEKDCAGRAVRIANSKFSEAFNPVFGNETAVSIMADKFDKAINCEECDDEKKKSMTNMLKECMVNGGSEEECKSEIMKKLEDKLPTKIKENKIGKMNGNRKQKSYTFEKKTPPDAMDGHLHDAYYDENGNGATSLAGSPEHHHMIFNFRVQNYFFYDPDAREEYTSAHPGSLAFVELGDCEMEIFRAGIHNGDNFTEKDLEDIASNFSKLKSEVRPKLKITHRENQESIAGLASYGDIVEVFIKKVSDGTKRLFAKIASVPKQVLELIKDRRFPERSIEIYPEFKLGTKENSPVYKNVLKAVALLGHEMPAVTGMDPVKLEECFECQGTVCFRESHEEISYNQLKNIEALSKSIETDLLISK